MFRQARPLWLLVMLAACDGGAAPVPSASAASAGLCAKAEALRERLAPLDVAASRVPVPAAITLPQAGEGASVPEDATLVAFDGKTFVIEGKSTEAGEEAAQLVEERRKMMKEAGFPVPRSTALALDASIEAPERLEAFFKALGDGASVHVIAGLAGGRREPIPKALEKGFDALDPMGRAGALAVELKRALARCPQASKLFEHLAAADPAARAPTLKQKLPEAVAACACAVSDDLPDLIAFALGADPPVVGKHVVISTSADSQRVAIGPGAQAIYDALPGRGTRVNLQR